MKALLAIGFLAAALPAAAAAADLTGNWKATLPDQGDGVVREITLTLKQQGGILTGRVGDGAPISEGKVSGDSFSFALVGPRGKGIFRGRLVKGELQTVQSREGDDEHMRPMVFKKLPDDAAR